MFLMTLLVLLVLAPTQNPQSHPPVAYTSEINSISFDKDKSQQQPGSKKKIKCKKNKYSSP